MYSHLRYSVSLTETFRTIPFALVTTETVFRNSEENIITSRVKMKSSILTFIPFERSQIMSFQETWQSTSLIPSLTRMNRPTMSPIPLKTNFLLHSFLLIQKCSWMHFFVTKNYGPLVNNYHCNMISQTLFYKLSQSFYWHSKIQRVL